MDGWMVGWLNVWKFVSCFTTSCLVTSLLCYIATLLPRFLGGSLAGCLVASPFRCPIASKFVS